MLSTNRQSAMIKLIFAWKIHCLTEGNSWRFSMKVKFWTRVNNLLLFPKCWQCKTTQREFFRDILITGHLYHFCPTFCCQQHNLIIDAMIDQKRKTVLNQMSKLTPRRELKIWRVAKYFWRASRCLEMWSNTVLSVWYIFLTETKTKEKTENKNGKNLC